MPATESKTVRVWVEQRHIDAGKSMDCQMCPIALVIKDAVRPTMGDVKVSVDGAIRIGGLLCPCPDEASQAWRRFDLGRGMEPFSFNLSLEQLV